MANEEKARWSEDNSQEFIDCGRYFVPERETQIEIISGLVPASDAPFHVLELCCGEGLLAEAILERHPTCTLHGYDGSPAMLVRAAARLAPFGRRFDGRLFDLADDAWRRPPFAIQAVVSSLCIHHLDGPQKAALYRDVGRILEPGGVLIIADLIEPTTPLGLALAARGWDEAVRRRALALDGEEAVFRQFQHRQWNIFRYPDPFDKPSPLYDQLAWLQAAGIEAVDVFWLSAGHAIYGGQMPAG
ncbi:MAG: class I SAM-dependent methyltransferase [Chloroflexota bacterium]|jgi:tRNA (cmo5U34)-methyltransferase